MKRRIIPVILIIAAACMNNGATNARPTPAPTADYAPNATNGAINGAKNGNGAAGTADDVKGGATGINGNTAATSDGALNPFDWANGTADIEKAVARISEVCDARVVVTNSTALVGVKFDNVYKGEMTGCIREMVAAEVLKAGPSIRTVAVTATGEDVKKICDLSEQIRAGRTAGELSAEINAIVRNATTLR